MTTQNKERAERMIIEKDTMAASLSYLKDQHQRFNLSIRPFPLPNNRIAFEVSGRVTEALEYIQTNPKVELLSFLAHLSTIRTQIFSLKG